VTFPERFAYPTGLANLFSGPFSYNFEMPQIDAQGARMTLREGTTSGGGLTCLVTTRATAAPFTLINSTPVPFGADCMNPVTANLRDRLRAMQ